jgi:hypothetical protein
MPRKNRPLDRDNGVVRDASLVVIACEDTHAVEQYFARFRTRRVQFIVLPTEGGRSSPQDVLSRLDHFKQTEATEEGDVFWICIDTDHWVKANHIQNLREVLQQCRQKSYDVAISNPCFELWLLLHFDQLLSAVPSTCDAVVSALRRVAGSYRKNRCDLLTITPAQVQKALAMAKRMDSDPNEILPSYPVSRVYRLIEVLQNRDSIELNP